MPRHGRCALAAATTAAVVLLCPWWPALRPWARLVRNAATARVPPAVAPRYAACSASDVVRSVTVVVAVKDTCSQSVPFLAHLAHHFPRNGSVVYVHPRFRGCRDVSVQPMRALFPRLVVLSTPPTSSPIDGFLEARRRHAARTPYVLLLHNDAYAMDSHAVCELLGALRAHPRAAFAAPQLYERSESGTVVPHAHHRNLHLRAVAPPPRRPTVMHDVDFDLLTRRLAGDFEGTEGAQLDFLEDHAYMARAESYHRYVDPMASFTLEYIDNVLAMRANGTYPWFVPTARFVFDVSARKVAWNDVAYFAWKRSERVALTVRAYLSEKWSADFPVTGVGNYVRHTMLRDVRLEGPALPARWEDQCALFLAWFESVGFDRYGPPSTAASLAEALHDDGGACRGGRALRHLRVSRGDARSVLDAAERDAAAQHAARARTGQARVPPASALLAEQRGAKRINVSSGAVRGRLRVTVDATCDPDACGMLVASRHGGCACYSYHPPGSARSAASRAVHGLLDRLKLPARALDFVHLCRRSAVAAAEESGIDEGSGCDCDYDSACSMRVSFASDAVLVRWSWTPS